MDDSPSLPGDPQLERMAEQFVVDEQLYFPFEHAGSFRSRLSEWTLSQAAQKPFFAALLAAIIACESARQAGIRPANDAEVAKKREAELASRRYVEIALETLRLGG
jgi:transketolase